MAPVPSEDDICGIYRETIEALYGFVSRRCDGDRQLAEDLTQETWLRAVRAWRADGLPENPGGWLSTVAARLISNHYRRPAIEPFADGVGDRVPAPDAAAAREVDDKRSLMERALARLPLTQTRLLEAFHYERRAVADIATSSGLSERAVEGRLRRARQNLRRQLEIEGGADGDDT